MQNFKALKLEMSDRVLVALIGYSHTVKETSLFYLFWYSAPIEDIEQILHTSQFNFCEVSNYSSALIFYWSVNLKKKGVYHRITFSLGVAKSERVLWTVLSRFHANILLRQSTHEDFASSPAIWANYESQCIVLSNRGALRCMYHFHYWDQNVFHHVVLYF